MKPTKITFSLGATYNLGNFESARVDAGIEITLEEKDTPEVAYKKAFSEVKKVISEQTKLLQRKTK